MTSRTSSSTLIALVAILPALGGCEETSEPETVRPPADRVERAQPESRVEASLPAAVERKKDAVVRAARSFDYTGLGELLDPAAFSYSFGEEGDPIAYWQRMEDGHFPIVGDLLPSVLATTPGLQGEIYVWPAAFAKASADWSRRDITDLRSLHSPEDIERFRRLGSYTGWRVGIRADGTWLFFIAGD